MTYNIMYPQRFGKLRYYFLVLCAFTELETDVNRDSNSLYRDIEGSPAIRKAVSKMVFRQHNGAMLRELFC